MINLLSNFSMRARSSNEDDTNTLFVKCLIRNVPHVIPSWLAPYMDFYCLHTFPLCVCIPHNSFFYTCRSVRRGSCRCRRWPCLRLRLCGCYQQLMPYIFVNCPVSLRIRKVCAGFSRCMILGDLHGLRIFPCGGCWTNPCSETLRETSTCGKWLSCLMFDLRRSIFLSSSALQNHFRWWSSMLGFFMSFGTILVSGSSIWCLGPCFILASGGPNFYARHYVIYAWDSSLYSSSLISSASMSGCLESLSKRLVIICNSLLSSSFRKSAECKILTVFDSRSYSFMSLLSLSMPKKFVRIDMGRCFFCAVVCDL